MKEDGEITKDDVINFCEVIAKGGAKPYEFIVPNRKLPYFWWLFKGDKYENIRHPYTCPFLMSLSAIISGAEWHVGEFARVIKGNCEILCWFPKWMILMECRFWNWKAKNNKAHPPSEEGVTDPQ